jgi:hypothetical protein
MSHWEEALLRRFSGRTIVVFGLSVAAIGVLPLLLYVAFGPEDGNPIGLGLLAMVAIPTGAMIAIAGIIKLLVGFFGGSKA